MIVDGPTYMQQSCMKIQNMHAFPTYMYLILTLITPHRGTVYAVYIYSIYMYMYV